MIWLSRLTLELRSRDVRKDLRDCNDLHRSIMQLFPGVEEPQARQALKVLYRVEQNGADRVEVLVQSSVAPEFSRLPKDYLRQAPQSKVVDRIPELLRSGNRLHFRLRANPTRAIDTKTRPDGTKSNGKRVELRGEEALTAWLRRKGEQHGFRPLAFRIDAGPTDPRVSGGKIKGHRTNAPLTLASVLFDGILEVTDPKLLLVSLEAGIGRGKSYGHGLLSVAPARDLSV